MVASKFSSIYTSIVQAPGSNGGAIRGYMPPASGVCTDKRYPEYEHIRFTLKQGWAFFFVCGPFASPCIK